MGQNTTSTFLCGKIDFNCEEENDQKQGGLTLHQPNATLRILESHVESDRLRS